MQHPFNVTPISKEALLKESQNLESQVLAWRMGEKVVNQQFKKRPIRVELTGLHNIIFNGQRGERLKYYPTKDRYSVLLDSTEDSSGNSTRKSILIRPRNLILLPFHFGKAKKQATITNALHGLVAPYKKGSNGNIKIRHDLIKYCKIIFSYLVLESKFLSEELSCLCILFKDSLQCLKNISNEPISKKVYHITVPSKRFPDLYTAMKYMNDYAGENRFIDKNIHEIRIKPGKYQYIDPTSGENGENSESLTDFFISRSNFKITGYGKHITVIQCKSFCISRFATQIEIKDLSVEVPAMLLQLQSKQVYSPEASANFSTTYGDSLVGDFDCEYCTPFFSTNKCVTSRKKAIHLAEANNKDECSFMSSVNNEIKTIKFNNKLSEHEEPVKISNCDFIESRVSIDLMMDSGTMLNRSCVLGLPSVTRNLLEAGAHMESSCRITGDNDSNGYPLENCLAFCEDLYSNYGGSSLIDQKLEVLDVLLKHQALNINTQVRKSGHFKMTILQSLLMSSSSGPKYHPLRKEFAKHKWRQEYYYLSRKAALRLLEEPTINISFIEPLTGGNIVRAACYHNSPTVLQRLIDLGADINNVDCDNVTPLFYCLSNDYFECAKVLASAKGHRKDVLNMIHIKGGLCEVNLKKNGGKDIDKQLCQIGYGNTIATWATLRLGTQQEELFELICQIPGIDLNKSSEMMFNAGTPLQTAAMIGNYKRVKVLLKYGGTHETWKLDAAINACAKGDLQILKEIVKHIGIDALKNAKSKDFERGMFPLWCASQCNHPRIVKYLLDKGVDIERSNAEGTTSLLIAIQYGNIDVVDVLLKHGCNVNYVKKKDNSTALTNATFHGHPTIVQMLLDAGAKINHQDEDGWTSLFLAATKNFPKCAKLLLNQKKIEVDCPTYDFDRRAGGGYSPLCAVIMQGNYSMAKLLLDHGANGNFITKSGATPFSIAKWGQQSDIFHLSLAGGNSCFNHNPNQYSRIEAILRSKGFLEEGTPPNGRIVEFMEHSLTYEHNDDWNANGIAKTVFVGGRSHEGSKEKRGS